ncbi:MAG TPA: efflux RND transporter periplasmic adaptor subunit, partial [Pseudothermotoga sp.]
ALVSGVVKKIYVKEGDTVKAGDLLVELDDTDYRLSYLKALQNYELAKNSGSKLLIEQRQLELDIAKRDLDRCKITSPVDGIVTALNVEVNDYVSKGTTVDVVARVVNVNNLYVSASVEEMDYSKIKVGQTASLTFEAFEGVNFPAKVTYVGSEAQTSSGIVTIPIKLNLISPKSLQQSSTSTRGQQLEELMNKIIPGLSCEAEIVVMNKTNVMVVPTGAITYESGKAYVTVKNGNTTEKRQVSVGEKFSSGYEILDGLKEGEVIIINRTSTSSGNAGRIMIPMGGPAPGR